MQAIVLEKPYRFIPPRFSPLWHGLLRRILPWHLRRVYGIVSVECKGQEKLRASLDAGHGILLAPNHCRPCDPMVLDYLSAAVNRPFGVIASWHVFMAGAMRRFLIPRVGGFSVYREGMDRESLKCATGMVAEGRHPLVVFPEGVITRNNDRLAGFMEGPAFIARAAAKQRTDGMAVVHPVFIRYFFEGDLGKTIEPVIAEIEKRLSWQPRSHLPLLSRLKNVGDALLALKEIEYFRETRHGDRVDRLHFLQDHLLVPLEQRWTSGRHDGDDVARIKRLRSAIVPGLNTGTLTEPERASRWRDLADLYLVQQLQGYTGGHSGEETPERILETVERFEEDLTDAARAHSPIRAVITVGDPIEAGPSRDKSRDSDSVTLAIRHSLEGLMESSKALRAKPPTGVPMS